MPRVLLDTNLLVSAVLFRGRSRALLDAALVGDLDLVTSEALLEEFQEVLVRKFSFPVRVAREIRAEFETLAHVVEPLEVPNVCRDPDDNQVLAAAVAGSAEQIITGDLDLLELGSYQGVGIFSPASYLEQRPEPE